VFPNYITDRIAESFKQSHLFFESGAGLISTLSVKGSIPGLQIGRQPAGESKRSGRSPIIFSGERETPVL